MKKMKLVIVFLLLFIVYLFIIPEGKACIGPVAETRTFLRCLPEKCSDKSVVAKIKILETKINPDKLNRISVVIVIEPIKGIKANSIIKVISKTHSCARDYNVKKNEYYYIAGEINKSGYFIGEWQGWSYLPKEFDKFKKCL